MRVEKGMEGKKDKSKTDKEKEGEDEKKGQGEDEKEDKEKIAKDIRRLCRIYLKVMHELRDDRTRQSQVIKKWKEKIERRKRRDNQGLHEEQRTLLGWCQ